MTFNRLKSFRSWALAFACMAIIVSCSDDKKNDDPQPDANATQYIASADGKTITVKDLGKGTGSITWTADKTYILENFVFVNEGQTLTIQPGTVIKGKPGQASNASALIVARGGKIIADGTAEKPIIFTAEADDVNNPNQPEDQQRGLWGGLILLGKAVINPAVKEKAIEGIPTTEKRGIYGGNDDSDNSGILHYVSIRHGGTAIASGNEINGLTLGAVGSGTDIAHVEIVHTADDGIEFFGGTANVKYLVSAFNDDDGIDYDEGYRGNIQHALVWQSIQNKVGDNGGEFDGGTDPIDAQPYSKPTLSNITIVGAGKDSTSRRLMLIRENSGGYFHNSIFTEFGKGVEIEDVDNAQGEDSYNRVKSGDLAFQGNVFWNVTNNDTAKVIRRVEKTSKKSFSLYGEVYQKGGNQIADPGIILSHINNKVFNPVPNNGAIHTNVKTVDNFWFDKVSYRGAFQPGSSNWLKGWSYLSTHHFLAD